MRVILQIGATIIALVMTGISAKAQKQNNDVTCDIALFKTMETEKVSKDNYAFIFDLVTQDNYSQMQEGLKVWVQGYFDGEWSSFKEKRDKFRSEKQIVTHDKYSRDYAINTLSDNGLKGYSECLRAKTREGGLFVYRLGAADIKDKVTFTVELKSSVVPANPVKVMVNGAGPILSGLEKGMKATNRPGDIVEILIPNIAGPKNFIAKRKSYKGDFEVTASLDKENANPLSIGPALRKVTKTVARDEWVDHRTHYIARKLDIGGYDSIWATDGRSGNSNGVAQRTSDAQSVAAKTFEGNACLCISRQTTSWDQPYSEAGLCVPGRADDVAGNLENVRFGPQKYLTAYSCGGQMQPAVTGPSNVKDGVCYKIELRLAPPDDQSKECIVSWNIMGKLKRKETVFEPVP